MPNRNVTPSTPSRGLYPLRLDPFTSFRREIDRLFDGFFAPTVDAAAANTAGNLWPSVDLHETDQAYNITVELPGIEEKDIEVNLRDNAVSISGEKRSEHKEEDGGRAYTERSYGRFQRTIPLDAEVDADKVQASFKNGVLAIELPKNPAASEKARRIEVKSQ